MLDEPVSTTGVLTEMSIKPPLAPRNLSSDLTFGSLPASADSTVQLIVGNDRAEEVQTKGQAQGKEVEKDSSAVVSTKENPRTSTHVTQTKRGTRGNSQTR